MTFSYYLSYVLLTATMVYSPGPMTLFILVNGIQSGFRKTLPVLFGASTSYFVAIIIFAVGLSSIIQKNTFLLKGVQLGGIFYIVYLAYGQWTKDKKLVELQVQPKTDKSYFLYRKGFLTAFSNPKTILLFSVVFPQFVRGSQHKTLDFVLLGATFLSLQFSSGCFYSYFGQRIQHALQKPSHQVMINKVCAISLLMIAGLLSFAFRL
jgi:homoserine/homoserine lactone efflux protein